METTQRNKVRIKGYSRDLNVTLAYVQKQSPDAIFFLINCRAEETTWDDFPIEKVYFGIFKELHKHAALWGITWNG